jgi:hypothetical protein
LCRGVWALPESARASSYPHTADAIHWKRVQRGRAMQKSFLHNAGA